MNKSAQYTDLTVTITNIKDKIVSYTLYYAKNSREFNWKGSSKRDLEVISQLVVGRSYNITVSQDHWGTQHWDRISDLTKATAKDSYFTENYVDEFRASVAKKRRIELDLKLVIYDDE